MTKIVSMGSNCPPGLSCRTLGIKGETYPFDWIRSNSKIIHDVLVNGPDKYLLFGKESSDEYYVKDLHSYTQPGFSKSHINYYGQHFTHYTDMTPTVLHTTFKRYMDRFFELLHYDKKIIFLHTHEEYRYHKKSRDDKIELNDYLCKINDILMEKYPNLDFKILNIDYDNKFQDYKNIKNISIDGDKMAVLDYCEKPHYKQLCSSYRNHITNKLSTQTFQNLL